MARDVGGDAKIRVLVPFVGSDERISSSRVSIVLPVLAVGKEADEQFEEYVEAIEEMGTTANEVINVSPPASPACNGWEGALVCASSGWCILFV